MATPHYISPITIISYSSLKASFVKTGTRSFFNWAAIWKKFPLLVVDAREPMTLNENGDGEIAHIKNKKKEVIWKQDLE